jgi:hypothetical protein
MKTNDQKPTQTTKLSKTRKLQPRSAVRAGAASITCRLCQW